VWQITYTQMDRPCYGNVSQQAESLSAMPTKKPQITAFKGGLHVECIVQLLQQSVSAMIAPCTQSLDVVTMQIWATYKYWYCTYSQSVIITCKTTAVIRHNCCCSQHGNCYSHNCITYLLCYTDHSIIIKHSRNYRNLWQMKITNNLTISRMSLFDHPVVISQLVRYDLQQSVCIISCTRLKRTSVSDMACSTNQGQTTIIFGRSFQQGHDHLSQQIQHHSIHF